MSLDIANPPIRLWKIWWWDENDKKHTAYENGKTEDDIIKICNEKGITKYCIFNDKFKHVITDGSKVVGGRL